MAGKGGCAIFGVQGEGMRGKFGVGGENQGGL